MSDEKWRDVGANVSIENLFNAVFGVEKHTVENTETGEYREVTIGRWDGPQTVGEAIEKGEFDD